MKFIRKIQIPKLSANEKTICINNKIYVNDTYSNITDHILSYLDRKLLHQPFHPLSHLKNKIQIFFHRNYLNHKLSPIFSIHDNIDPIVSTRDNFDNLLIPSNHISRSPTDTYYINSKYVLRTHTSSHQIPLMKTGLDSFLIMGDVYRRDTIDSTHFPVFHQLEGLRLYTKDQLFQNTRDNSLVFMYDKVDMQNYTRNNDRQACHSLETAKVLELNLKKVLQDLILTLFGPKIETRWVPTFFPFTHPSWELEIKHNNEYLEVLGCGIMEQELINKAGAENRVGWAFGIGLERIAMLLYEIPDIRLFWSRDSGFLNQFNTNDPNAIIKFKPISKFPQCINDISFWLSDDPKYPPLTPNDFCDLVRGNTNVNISEFSSDHNTKSSETIDLVEQVKLIDEFTEKATGRKSMCFRIIYRHPMQTLSKECVNLYHKRIERALIQNYGVVIR